MQENNATIGARAFDQEQIEKIKAAVSGYKGSLIVMEQSK